MDSSEVRSTISEIYDRFLILPNLRMHMFRVASVAEILCDNWHGTINKKDIVAACLMHDIGNIVKFDLMERDAPLLGKEVKRLDYWRKAKTDTMRKYGSTDHEATHNMMVELGVSGRVLSLVDHMIDVLREESVDDYELMLCNYADDRVGPGGVMSISERFTDFANRYSKSDSKENKAKGIVVESLTGRALNLEKRLFLHIGITPEHINDKNIKPYLDRYTK